jgi:hypothetical protein
MWPRSVAPARCLGAPRASPVRDLFQLSRDRARTRKQLAIHLFESIVGREKHEAAWHAHGDADDPPVELNCKSLVGHEYSPRREAASARARSSAASLQAPVCLDDKWTRSAGSAKRS